MGCYALQGGVIHACFDYYEDGPDGSSYWEAACGEKCFDNGADLSR